MGRGRKCWAVTRSVNHSNEETVLACGWKCECAGPKLGRESLFGEYGHAGKSGLQWAGMLEGMCCQSFYQSQEHGKANTELISKTSKAGRFLPKIARTCPSVSLPHFLALPAAPPSILPLVGYSNPTFLPLQTFLFHSALDTATKPLASPSVLIGARCFYTWHHHNQSSLGTEKPTHARELESSFTH